MFDFWIFWIINVIVHFLTDITVVVRILPYLCLCPFFLQLHASLTLVKPQYTEHFVWTRDLQAAVCCLILGSRSLFVSYFLLYTFAAGVGGFFLTQCQLSELQGGWERSRPSSSTLRWCFSAQLPLSKLTTQQKSRLKINFCASCGSLEAINANEDLCILITCREGHVQDWKERNLKLFWLPCPRWSLEERDSGAQAHSKADTHIKYPWSFA